MLLAVVSAIAGALTRRRMLYWAALAFGVLVVLISVWEAITYTISVSAPFFFFGAMVVVLAMAGVLTRKRVLYWVALALGVLAVLFGSMYVVISLIGM